MKWQYHRDWRKIIGGSLVISDIENIDELESRLENTFDLPITPTILLLLQQIRPLAFYRPIAAVIGCYCNASCALNT